MNLPMKQKQTQRHKIQTCGFQEARGVREPWTGGFGLADANYYTEWINNRVLPVLQHRELYLIINHNYKKNVYIYE